MKQFNSAILFIALIFCALSTEQSYAQLLDLPRASQQASVSQTVGISKVYIHYSRPSVNGREVWGKLVPYGMNNLGFGTSTEAPWRAGANENTVIKFTHDVTVEGQPLKAGKYGLHMMINEDGRVTVIFSKNSTAWGSFFYDPSEDALRVDVNSMSGPHVEQLTYEFVDVTAKSATALLKWEKKQIPFKIEFDVADIVLTDIRKKLQDQPGFTRQTWEQAANFSLNNNGDLNEALTWIEGTIAGQFFSQPNFNNINIKAQILAKLDRKDEAVTTLEGFIPQATILEVHQIGRTFIGMGMTDKALEVFKINAENHEDTWPVHYGMARGYSAKGDYHKALTHLRKALENAPNPASKGRVQANIDKLERGEDIN
ncbi:MAG: DUF2911 domain-containing protein [Flavobacteriaceae bacterium]|nr:DUF2911 domain-containing protein [Flavobacteriaceae bacterium]